MTEPWEEWDAYCRKEERREELLIWPVCVECGEKITEDYHYIIDDEHICENCITDYVTDNYRMQTAPEVRDKF